MELALLGGAIVSNAPYLIGFVLPPFVEILNKDVKNENERYLVALIVCLLVSVVLHWNEIVSGSPEVTLAYTGVIFLESNTIFKLYFANSWIRGKLQQPGQMFSAVGQMFNKAETVAPLQEEQGTE